DFVDRLAIQGVVDRQAYALVVPRRFRIPLLGELDPVDRRVLRRYQLQSRVALHIEGVLAVERVGDVGLAVLEHRHARRPLGYALHDVALDRGHAAPVARVRLHHDLDAGLVADETIRAGADWLLSESLVADLGDVLLRDDDPGGGRGRPVERHEVGPRLGQVEAQR